MKYEEIIEKTDDTQKIKIEPNRAEMEKVESLEESLRKEHEVKSWNKGKRVKIKKNKIGITNNIERDYPLFTVAVITYMQRHLIEECLESIIKQNYPNIEIVVCDDDSADFNEENVRAFIESNRKKNIKNVVVYKQSQNVGTVNNATKAIELSSGVYFKLHAGDDMLYDQNVLQDIADEFGHPEINLIAARSVACQQDGTMTDHYYPSWEALTSLIDAGAEKQFELIGTQTWGEFINAPAVFWRRSFFDQMGGFDPSYRYTEDWPMWLKITGSGHQITGLKKVTTIYRYGGISNDSSALNMSLGSAHYQECIRMIQEMVLPKFEAEGKKIKIFRAKQCIRCIQARIISESDWSHWNVLQKFSWRVRNLKMITISWAYRRKKYGISVNLVNQYKIISVCALLYMLHVQPWPGTDVDFLWANIFFVALVWLMAKVFLKLSINIMKITINLLKGKESI